MKSSSSLTRRSFIKRSSFAATSLLVMSQGIALSNPEGDASNSSGSGCKKTETLSFDDQTEKTKRVDTYIKYKEKDGDVYIYVVSSGAETQASDSQMAPGNYPATFTIQKGDKTCKYKRVLPMAVPVYTSDSGWVQDGGTASYTPAFSALPQPWASWEVVTTHQMNMKRTRMWDSVQGYELE